jgi:cobalt-zinc-cadmium efflux system membrane fusion protein
VHDRPTSRVSRALRPLPRQTQIGILAVAALTALTVMVGGPKVLGYFAKSPERAAPAEAPGTFRPTPAQWASLKFASIQTLTFRTEQVTDGRIAIDDDRTTPVFSPYSGRVTRLMAKAGDHVERGAPLMAVEATEFVQGQNDLIAAAAALRKARSQLSLTLINEKRQHELYEAKAGALRDWEQARTDLAAAQSDLRSTEIALGAVRNRLRILGKSEAEIASLETARQIDPEIVITAPIAGTVTQRKVGLGQYISAGGSDPMFAIGDLSRVWLVANVRETDAPLMRVGQPVTVRVLAYPGRLFEARLTYVAASVDPTTHRLPVRAEVENPDRSLKPEMFAGFSITTGEDVAAPGVPADAIVYEGDSARVWVARDDGTLAARSILTGRTDRDGMVEVLLGVEPGEKIVTSGTLFIDRATRGD